LFVPAPADNSSAQAQALVATTLTEPPLLAQLVTFMTTFPEAPIPVLPAVLAKIGPGYAKYFIASDSELSRQLSPIIEFGEVLGSTEHFTLIQEHSCVIKVLLALDQHLPPDKCIGLVLQRDQGMCYCK
jgi:hypothetical protein